MKTTPQTTALDSIMDLFVEQGFNYEQCREICAAFLNAKKRDVLDAIGSVNGLMESGYFPCTCDSCLEREMDDCDESWECQLDDAHEYIEHLQSEWNRMKNAFDSLGATYLKCRDDRDELASRVKQLEAQAAPSKRPSKGEARRAGNKKAISKAKRPTGSESGGRIEVQQ